MRSRPRTAYWQARRPRTERGAGVHWFLLVALLLAAAFIEVWESTTASQLSLDIDRLQSRVRDGQARLAHLQATAQEASSRVRLIGHAERLGLQPADPEQLVLIPRDYLEVGREESVPSDGIAAIGLRAFETLVPTARARERGARDGGT